MKRGWSWQEILKIDDFSSMTPTKLFNVGRKRYAVFNLIH
jgi:hypothetical protein